MDIEHKAFKTSVEAGDVGEITALVSVFGNTDFANERVMRVHSRSHLLISCPKGCGRMTGNNLSRRRSKDTRRIKGWSLGPYLIWTLNAEKKHSVTPSLG